MLHFPKFILVLDLVTYAWSADRIVRGYEANITDFPYQLSVRRGGRPVCGGVLIAPKYGLSAAHCFKNPALYSVKAGSSLKHSGGVLNIVKRVLIHPEYASHRPDYDIAVMKFKQYFRFSQTIQPIKLPHKLDKISPGVAGVISGFGDMFEDQKTGSDTLRAAVIYVEDPDLCRNNYNKIEVTISRRMICAWVQGKIDSCQGDSGGPFAIDGVLHGIVSFGNGCADPNFPGVYAKVISYLEFIRLNTKP